MNSDEDCAAAGMARRSTGRTRQRPAVIRAARVTDAPQIALVHVRSWQFAYRGLLPQVYLDGLDPAQRVGRWERSLAEATDGRDGVLPPAERLGQGGRQAPHGCCARAPRRSAVRSGDALGA
jgi:hypothetical protein